ncbi:hypothetical protein Tco_0970776 [Tanacetum coccineum]
MIWIRIMGQVHANQGLTADLLGPDVTEENFAERMVKVIAERRRQFEKHESSVIYSTGWTLKHVKRSIKRPGAGLDRPTSKKSKSNEAQHISVPPASNPSTDGEPSNPSPFVDTPSHSPEFTPVSPPKPSAAAPLTTGPRTRSKSIDADIKTYTTRRKSLASRKMPSSEVDLNTPDISFIHVLSDDDSAGDTNPPFWHAFAAWEIVPTGLGDDLSKLYGMVVKHYEVNPLAGNGLLLWGVLHVLFDSTSGSSSKILYMFADTPYPLSVSLMKKMLKHKLEVEIDGVGNDMTHAVQLIKFIKNQLASSVPSV